MRHHRLSPEAFKKAARSKGWSMANLAFYWELSAPWLSVLIHNRERKAYWDDAVLGLPALTKREAAEITRTRLESKRAEETRSQVAHAGSQLPPTPRSPGFRYHGYLVPGSVVVTTEALYDEPEGSRGVVQALKAVEDEEHYLIDVSGNLDWFSPAYVDQYFVSTGEMAPL
jgi:hypothetical protein